ncbi:MAG TPA: DUF5668 domain-containing protein [Candidatus Limnocylindrales bacterium]|nr:DUF5668 domain-containing protein [Candidatus Limnocylindrales bacterium]
MTAPRDPDATTTSAPVPTAAAAPASGSAGRRDGGRYGGARRRRSGWDSVALFWGVVFVAVGLWFFATETLGIELPRVRWDAIWPVLLIVLGLIVVARGRRERRS